MKTISKITMPEFLLGESGCDTMIRPVETGLLPFAAKGDDPVFDPILPQAYEAVYRKANWEREGRQVFVLAELRPIYREVA